VLLLVLALLATACVGGQGSEGEDYAPRASIETSPPPTPLASGAWAAQNQAGAGRVDRADAVADARRFDIIVSLPSTYRRQVAAMKAANPQLVLLALVSATLAGHDLSPSALPRNWYLRDELGHRVRSNGLWIPQYLMDPSAPGWIRDRVRTCRRALHLSGYAGCMVDVLGLAPLDPNYVSGLPVDPATGEVWTNGKWLETTSHLAAEVKAHVAGAVVVGNGLMSGPRYFDPSAPTSQILEGVDGGVAEAWLRGAWQPLARYPTEEQWKQSVDMLADVEHRGKELLVLTKAWAAGTAAEKDAWHEFALASFLLGENARTFFSFSSGFNGDPTAADPMWGIQLGSPTGAYTQIDNAYMRSFQNGLVLVNPTLVATTVPLDHTYVTMRGTSVKMVTLEPHTAEILTRA